MRPQQQTAFRAGYADARAGKPMPTGRTHTSHPHYVRGYNHGRAHYPNTAQPSTPALSNIIDAYNAAQGD